MQVSSTFFAVYRGEERSVNKRIVAWTEIDGAPVPWVEDGRDGRNLVPADSLDGYAGIEELGTLIPAMPGWRVIFNRGTDHEGDDEIIGWYVTPHYVTPVAARCGEISLERLEGVSPEAVDMVYDPNVVAP